MSTIRLNRHDYLGYEELGYRYNVAIFKCSGFFPWDKTSNEPTDRHLIEAEFVGDH